MSGRWQDLDDLAPAHRAQLLDKVGAFVGEHPGAALDHEPAWLAAQAAEPDRATRFLVHLDDRDQITGYAPFLIHPSSLTVETGPYTLFGYSVRRFTLAGAPLFSADPGGSDRLVAGLFAKLSDVLGPRDLPFCLGMDLESEFARAVQTEAAGRGFRLLPRGPAYRRRLLALPLSFDEYMGQLGSKTRQDLRRQERRLQKEAGSVEFRSFGMEEEVPEFLDLAQRISRRTYQWNLLDLGVKDTAGTRRVLGAAAGLGWLRSYVMYCGGEPAAFMLGYLHKSTYYSLDIGYDPRWSEWSPGNVLHMYVVRDIIGVEPRVQCFDFMYGDNSNKQRLSNASRLEQNVYILPTSVRWRVITAAVQGANSVLESGGRFLDRRGVKARIRRFLRRRSVSNA